MPTSLIVGITGQDGAYLAKHLLAKGHTVIGTSRAPQAKLNRSSLDRLGISPTLPIHTLAPLCFSSVSSVVSILKPDEIFCLACQSSVGKSFSEPFNAISSIYIVTLNILESIRVNSPSTRAFFAGSAEIYGSTGDLPASESSTLNPLSPYGSAKASALNLVKLYRELYNMYVCTGILSNHESVLRSDHFVTKKIVNFIHKLSFDSNKCLKLGNIDIVRDWGWAPEFSIPISLMLGQEYPRDMIIATGESTTLRSFLFSLFEAAGYFAGDYIHVDQDLIRPSDAHVVRLDPSYAFRNIGWKSTFNIHQIAHKLVHNQLF